MGLQGCPLLCFTPFHSPISRGAGAKSLTGLQGCPLLLLFLLESPLFPGREEGVGGDGFPTPPTKQIEQDPQSHSSLDNTAQLAHSIL
jgi:hypothetical protein